MAPQNTNETGSQPSKATTRTTTLTVPLITVDTPVPVTEVVARLEREVNKQGSAGFMLRLKEARTRDEIKDIVNSITNGSDFLYFQDFPHSNWLNVFSGVTDTPYTSTYVIGNPVVAQTIMRHDLRAALHIPPRLLVREKEDRSGTEITYQLPSSVMILDNDPNIEAATKALDEKLARLVEKIARVDNDAQL
ncbi:hypothetical protein AX16_003164 [Volvariella volvacea WC 439]|nr:hypothetical protein AX16_003164 [Volvariella volvacea WC 439]